MKTSTHHRAVVPGRRSTAILLVLAALAEVAEQLLSPITGVSTRDDLNRIAAHQGQFTVSVLIGMAATLMYAPGFVGLAQAGAARSPRLARSAAWVSVASMAGFFAIRLGQGVELAGVRQGVDRRDLAHLVDGVAKNPIGAVVIVVFLGGSLVGLVLLGVVAWRAGLPRSGCLGLVAFAPLDLALPTHPLPWSHLVLLAALGAIGYALWLRPGISKAPSTSTGTTSEASSSTATSTSSPNPHSASSRPPTQSRNV